MGRVVLIIGFTNIRNILIIIFLFFHFVIWL